MNEQTVENVGQALPLELARVRRLRQQYDEIGQSGQFGLGMIDVAIRRAEVAFVVQDVSAMCKCLAELQSLE